MRSGTKKIETFALLCNSYSLQQWQADCINQLLNGGIRLTLIIMDDSEATKKTTSSKLKKYPYKKMIYRIYQRFLFHPTAKSNTDLSTEFQNIPVLKSIPERKKRAYYFSDQDIATIKECQPDFLLRFGFGILAGEILNVAPYGLWSYHHDDNEIYRGVPSNFWEIYKNDAVNAAILQKLSPTIDGGPVLRKGFFPTIKHSWKENLNNAYFNSAAWPLQVCTDINNGNTDPDKLLAPKKIGKFYYLPTNSQMLRFFGKIIKNRIGLHLHELFSPEDWRIGVFPRDPQVSDKTIQQSDLMLPPPPRHACYHADPFLFETAEELHLLFEDYDYRHQKGKICGYIYNKEHKQWQPKKDLLEKTTHLAYPFCFENEGKFYCMPENAQANQLELYEYLPAQQELRFIKSLIENRACIDASLLHYKGMWYLFFTVPGASNYELHIYYSKELTGTYQPHANNPVKQDIRSARPGGNFIKMGGKILRPAQNCAESYGSKLEIMEIENLSPIAFQEKVFAEIVPDKHNTFNKGLHTLGSSKNYHVCDLKRYRYNSYNFRNKLLEKLKIKH